jgi:hypothetical protein
LSKVVGGGNTLDINFVNERVGFALVGPQLNGEDIYKSTDGGENWFIIMASNSNYYTNMFFTDSLNGYVIGFSGKIIKTTNGGTSPVGIFTQTAEIPETFTLFQNYPNPFNPTTKINYKLRVTSYVKINVFDVLGKEVVTLVNQKQNAGSYEVDFDGSNQPSGIYFYSLELDKTKIDSRKMLLIK